MNERTAMNQILHDAVEQIFSELSYTPTPAQRYNVGVIVKEAIEKRATAELIDLRRERAVLVERLRRALGQGSIYNPEDYEY